MTTKSDIVKALQKVPPMVEQIVDNEQGLFPSEELNKLLPLLRSIQPISLILDRVNYPVLNRSVWVLMIDELL